MCLDLEKIIFHCLRKDPDRRFQHMDDLKVALLDSKEESESSQVVRATETGVRGAFRRRWALACMAVLFLAAAGVAGLGFFVPGLTQRRKPFR